MTAVNHCVRPIAGVWDTTFVELLASAESRLVLCTPFVSQDGAKAVAAARTSKSDIGQESLMLTDLSPRAVCAGATDPEAVSSVGSTLRTDRIVHLPRLHAKVYVADGKRAVVTSGNLTSGGLGRNYEYGVYLDDPALALRIQADVLEYASLGAEIDRRTLARYCDVAADARAAFAKQTSSASRVAQKRLSVALGEAEDTLIRAQLAGGALHTVFARTILFLLRRHGSLTTQQIHPMVQQLHGDLCDDAVERIIDGVHFGKKWKHAVRTAQQQLKKAGSVALVGGKWRLVD